MHLWKYRVDSFIDFIGNRMDLCELWYNFLIDDSLKLSVDWLDVLDLDQVQFLHLAQSTLEDG